MSVFFRAGFWGFGLRAAAVLAFAGATAGQAAAEPSPSLKINSDPSGIEVVADAVPVTQILDELSGRLHFKIEYPATAGQGPIVTGQFKGDLNDLLRRHLLTGVSYATYYHDGAVSRVVVMQWNGSPDLANTRTPAAAAKPTQVAQGQPAAATASPVTQMLQTQVRAMSSATAQQSGNTDTTAGASISGTVGGQGGSAGTTASTPASSAPASSAPAAAASSAAPASSAPSGAAPGMASLSPADQASLAAATQMAQQNVKALAQTLATATSAMSTAK